MSSRTFSKASVMDFCVRKMPRLNAIVFPSSSRTCQARSAPLFAIRRLTLASSERSAASDSARGATSRT